MNKEIKQKIKNWCWYTVGLATMIDEYNGRGIKIYSEMAFKQLEKILDDMKDYNELKEDLLKDDAILQEYEDGCRTTLDK